MADIQVSPTKTIKELTLRRNVTRMLNRIEAGYYDVTDESEQVDRKAEPERWQELRVAYVKRLYELNDQYHKDAIKAVGLKDHPKRERVAHLSSHTLGVTTYYENFWCLINMASLVLNTEVIGYSGWTGRLA